MDRRYTGFLLGYRRKNFVAAKGILGVYYKEMELENEGLYCRT